MRELVIFAGGEGAFVRERDRFHLFGLPTDPLPGAQSINAGTNRGGPAGVPGLVRAGPGCRTIGDGQGGGEASARAPRASVRAKSFFLE